MKLRFQFGLRTLLVAVGAIAVLLSQWPLVEWVENRRPHSVTIGQTIYGTIRDPWDGYYVVPDRVWRLAAIEAVLIAGWQLLAWMRRRRINRNADAGEGPAHK